MACLSFPLSRLMECFSAEILFLLPLFLKIVHVLAFEAQKTQCKFYHTNPSLVLIHSFNVFQILNEYILCVGIY